MVSIFALLVTEPPWNCRAHAGKVVTPYGRTGGAPTDPRTQIATFAEYYLLADPKYTFLDFYGGYAPPTPWSQHFAPAVNFNVGQPKGETTSRMRSS